jgi:hypothetical protein
MKAYLEDWKKNNENVQQQIDFGNSCGAYHCRYRRWFGEWKVLIY